jgi:hypothetical protein
MQDALDLLLWPYVGEMFTSDAVDSRDGRGRQVAPDPGQPA